MFILIRRKGFVRNAVAFFVSFLEHFYFPAQRVGGLLGKPWSQLSSLFLPGTVTATVVPGKKNVWNGRFIDIRLGLHCGRPRSAAVYKYFPCCNFFNAEWRFRAPYSDAAK